MLAVKTITYYFFYIGHNFAGVSKSKLEQVTQSVPPNKFSHGAREAQDGDISLQSNSATWFLESDVATSTSSLL